MLYHEGEVRKIYLADLSSLQDEINNHLWLLLLPWRRHLPLAEDACFWRDQVCTIESGMYGRWVGSGLRRWRPKMVSAKALLRERAEIRPNLEIRPTTRFILGCDVM
jgi:hypothetical protein